MDRAKTLAQVIWPCFSQLSHNQASIFQRAGSMIPMSQCSCCGLMLWMLPNAWLCYRWIFRRSLVADGNFTADHMKIRCPEDDVNLTHGYGYMVEEGRYKQHLSDAQEFKEVPSSQTFHLS